MSTPTSAATGTPTAPTGNSFVGDVRVNVKRWTRKAIRNPTSFVIEIVLAIVSLLLFASVFGDVGGFALEQAGFVDVEYVTFLLPAVLLQATMGSAFGSGMGLVGALQTGMFEKVVATPMSWTAVFAGKATAELAQISLQLLAVIGLAVGMGATLETGAVGVVGIVVVCLLVGLLFMGVSNVIGLLSRDEESLNAATMLFMFPLLFLSPAFLPLSSLSSEVELLATVNPITYGVDAIRALVLDRDVMTVVEVSQFGGLYDTLVPALAVLVGLNLVVGAIAVRMLSRASSAEAV